jgi:Tat protein secretion system quality control protein TatD with DNase activity
MTTASLMHCFTGSTRKSKTIINNVLQQIKDWCEQIGFVAIILFSKGVMEVVEQLFSSL